MNAREQTEIDRFRESIIAYLLTRSIPWKDEKEMREAVNATVGVIFGEGLPLTRQIINGS